MIRLSDGRKVWPYFDFELFGRERPFDRWQILQRHDLSLEVYLVAATELSSEHRVLVEQVIERALPGLPLTLHTVPELPRTPGGKFLESISEAQ